VPELTSPSKQSSKRSPEQRLDEWRLDVLKGQRLILQAQQVMLDGQKLVLEQVKRIDAMVELLVRNGQHDA
jgi:hypothetical protein